MSSTPNVAAVSTVKKESEFKPTPFTKKQEEIKDQIRKEVVKTDTVLQSAIVEEGPVMAGGEELDNEVESDEEADEQHISVSQLFGRGNEDDGEISTFVFVNILEIAVSPLFDRTGVR